MTHAHAFSLDRAINDAILPFTAPNPVNLPESAHPTLFAVEPEDPAALLLESHRAEVLSLQQDLRAERDAHAETRRRLSAAQVRLATIQDIAATGVSDTIHPMRDTTNG